MKAGKPTRQEGRNLLAVAICLAVIISFMGSVLVFSHLERFPQLYSPFLREPSLIRCTCASTETHPATFSSERSGSGKMNEQTSLMGQAKSVLRDNAGNGFLQLREYGAKPAHYGVSMLHQLHCLEMVKSALYGGEMGDHTHHRTRDVDPHVHVSHCFDYLMQVSATSGSITRCRTDYLAGDRLCGR
jgi:hypothetical protein